MKNNFFLGCATGLFLIGLIGIANATIVYDNTINSTGRGGILNNSLEVADLVTLGGTQRSVIEIKIETELTSIIDNTAVAGTADTQVRFYTNNGVPDTLLWDSGILDDLLYTPGYNLLTFSVPNVTVPDSFWWSIQVSDLAFEGYESLLLHINNPPTVGSSGNLYAINDPPWNLYTFGGDSVANFGAQISAVPEPTTMFLLGTGLVGVAGAARRKKKNQA